MQPAPFTISIPDGVLSDLHERLDRTRWPDEAPESGWQFGANLGYLQDLTRYWQQDYDWRACEAQINRFRQFRVELDGLPLHFIHEPGNGPNPLPLLLPHGWPSSVWEFHKLIPMLTDPARFGGDPADAFTVIAPSLPGYTMSFRPNQPRLGIPEIASLFQQLMTAVLGYPRFAVAGGDWGAFIATRLAVVAPDHLAGIHLSLLTLPRVARPLHDPTAEEAEYLRQLENWLTEESGYSAIQGTRPQTLAYGLTDSPVGLLAWIVEKFRAWSDCNGDVESRFTKDDLLTTTMLYWVTGAINSSFWPYYARRHEPWIIPPETRLLTPTAYAAFPKEIIRQPRAWAEKVFNIQRWTEMPAGGHFPAMEEPEALAADVRAFFRGLR